MSKIERIYLDMDGVLCNFVGASIVTCKLPISEEQVRVWDYYAEHMSTTAFWRCIDADKGFWFRLQPYIWADAVVNMCKAAGEVWFCSAPGADADSAAQKIEWLRHHGYMGRKENKYVLTPDKFLLANQSSVLIDDSDEQCTKFRQAGGIAVTFPQGWNIARDLVDDRLNSVRESLRLIVDRALVRGTETRTETAGAVMNPKDSLGSTKPGLSAVPFAPLYEVGAVITYGGCKYGRHNWREIGVRASVYFDAAMRHLTAWWEGETIDGVDRGGSGLTHLAHAIAGLLIYRDAEIQGKAIDDRPIATGNPSDRIKDAVAEIYARYPNPAESYLEVNRK